VREDARVPAIDYAALFAAAPTAYLVMSPDLVILDANDAYLATVGRTRGELVGRPIFDVFPPTPDTLDDDGVPRVQVSLERARDTGRPDSMPLQRYDIPDPSAPGGFVERFWSLISVPVPGPDGSTRLVVQRAEDITQYIRERDRDQAEAARGVASLRRLEQVEADLFLRAQELEAAVAARELASRRLARLAEVALQLAAAQSLADLASVVVDAGLAAIGADGGTLAVRDDERGVVRLLSTRSRAARGLPRDLPLDSSLPAAAVTRTGRPLLLPTRAAAAAWSAETAAAFESADRQTAVALPLLAGHRVLGAIVATWSQEHDLDHDELELLAAFAAQCAQVLDRLQVRAAEQRATAAARRLSETLQRSLLTEPPEPDHLEIVVRYLPAAREAKVGGDWYDAFLVPDGSTTLVIGDVAGHDRNAAAAMGQLRNILRGVAQSIPKPPAAVLSAFDRALQGLAVDTLATAVLAQVRQDRALSEAGLRALHWSNAGHPPPLLLLPDGRASLLQHEPDLLLGLDPTSPRTDHEVLLPPGAAVLLYTDGLVERRGESLDDSLERLRVAAEECAGLPLAQLCDGLLAMLADDPDDDVALVALRVHPEDQPRPPEAGPEVLPGRGSPA